ncbi:MAG: carbon storage regulator CsrA [Lentisphaeria bacterium]|jgi:carbon storage regulator|nr:carbon storage regulator CsrA [Lentisphaeria bacterium]MDP7742955.1 carbon storage regulator CsrA [Lentisphaeria bacterium]
MLVLTRRCNESIVIANDIEVKILKIQGSQVHLGINAPRSITVYREEVYQRVMSENKAAVHESSPGNSTTAKLHDNPGSRPDIRKNDRKKSPDS